MNEFKIKKGLIVNGSGSTILDIQGSQGQLFSVTDQLSGSLFSVNDISGIPIMEVFSNNTVNLGTFNAEAIKVSGSFATITGSLFGTASFASTASFVANAFIQGGNSFGTTATLGTNDNQSLQFETNGTTKMFVSSSGNVGVGTLNPQGVLNIVRASSGATRSTTAQELVLEHPFNVGMSLLGGEAKIAFGDAAASEAGLIQYVHSSDYMAFRTANTEKLRIDSSGNVGIGTTSPTSRLEIVSSSAANYLEALRVTNAGDSVGTSTGIRLQVASAANVSAGAEIRAIRTNSPTGGGSDLVFYTTPSTNTFSERWKILGTGVLEATGAQTVRTSTGNLTLATGGGDGNILLTPNGAGRVGIGTTIPESNVPLTVNTNNNAFNSTVLLQNSNTGTSALSQIQMRTQSSLSTPLNITKFNSNQSATIINEATSSLGLGTSGSVRLHIASNGDVGIGTTSPSSRLHVSGSALFENGGFVVDVTNNELIIDGNVGIQTPGSPESWVHISSDPASSNYLRIDAQNQFFPVLTTNVSPKDGFGDTSNNRYLAEPDYWMEIELNSNGNIVLIPCYLPEPL